MWGITRSTRPIRAVWQKAMPTSPNRQLRLHYVRGAWNETQAEQALTIARAIEEREQAIPYLQERLKNWRHSLLSVPGAFAHLMVLDVDYPNRTDRELRREYCASPGELAYLNGEFTKPASINSPGARRFPLTTRSSAAGDWRAPRISFTAWDTRLAPGWRPPATKWRLVMIFSGQALLAAEGAGVRLVARKTGEASCRWATCDYGRCCSANHGAFTRRREPGQEIVIIGVFASNCEKGPCLSFSRTAIATYSVHPAKLIT